MNEKNIEDLYEFSKKAILTNEMLTRWIRDLEERVRKLESNSHVLKVSGSSKDELAKPKINRG